MCSVSVISDYGRLRVQPEMWTRESFTQFQMVLRLLEELDKKLEQPHCEDSQKTQWMEVIEQRLSALESA